MNGNSPNEGELTKWMGAHQMNGNLPNEWELTNWMLEWEQSKWMGTIQMNGNSPNEGELTKRMGGSLDEIKEDWPHKDGDADNDYHKNDRDYGNHVLIRGIIWER